MVQSKTPQKPSKNPSLKSVKASSKAPTSRPVKKSVHSVKNPVKSAVRSSVQKREKRLNNSSNDLSGSKKKSSKTPSLKEIVSAIRSELAALKTAIYEGPDFLLLHEQRLARLLKELKVFPARERGDIKKFLQQLPTQAHESITVLEQIVSDMQDQVSRVSAQMLDEIQDQKVVIESLMLWLDASVQQLQHSKTQAAQEKILATLPLRKRRIVKLKHRFSL